ncbi:AAA family ATPase [bacterium]|nr:AAA family ATPase [bacterium]
MYLSRIEIENFRSLKKLTINLQAGLNVLVGRNNAGKTNLLYAIRHALGPAATRGEYLRLDREDFYRDSMTDETERTITIALTFSGLNEAQRAHFFEIIDFDLANIGKSLAIIRYEASWPRNAKRPSIKRTGGPVLPEAQEVPTQILESLPITFLPALRNAESSLSSGYRSRLALLLRDLAKRRPADDDEGQILDIYERANAELEGQRLIQTTRNSLQETTRDIAGSDYAPSKITAAEANFERILRSLQVQMEASPIESLDANGLGYNNLLYMAVVLEHLKNHDEDESPLLLVEEPEAHLHPQLTALLADYLSKKVPGKSVPQTIVTTHSPTLAATVPPIRIHVMFTDHDTGQVRCNGISGAAMTEPEQAELQRMMDITRATLYFAKGAIVVEGISEALLVPALAKRLGYDLVKEHISVIPICGVSFGTFDKLLTPHVHGIPVSIVTDGDPEIERIGDGWETDNPKMENGVHQVSDRTKNVLEMFRERASVMVHHSKVTLEYDLAEAAEGNPSFMLDAWTRCFEREPRTFNTDRLASAHSPQEMALVTWRGICRASTTRSKAEFAHQLAAALVKIDEVGNPLGAFVVPEYLRQAIEHVVQKSNPTADSAEVSTE